MMILTWFAVIAFFFGMGFSWPLIGACLIKCKLFPPKKKELFASEYLFISDWMVSQTVVGSFVIALIPIACMSFDATTVVYSLVTYFLISMFSGVLAVIYVSEHAKHVR